MPNNIDSMTNTNLQITGRPANGTAKTDNPAATSQEGSQAQAGAADSVELTQSARSLQALDARMSEVSEVDQQRVDEVRAKLESGQYSVDAQRVADKMIALDRSLPDGE